MDVAVSPKLTEWMGTKYQVFGQVNARRGIGVFESLDQPGYGPPRHIHHAEDETFYILEGEVAFWMAGVLTRHAAGALVSIPRGVEHTFRVIGDLPARMLTIMSPGGFEGFFAQMADNHLQIPQDMPQILAIAETFHLTFTGPPLGPDLD